MIDANNTWVLWSIIVGIATISIFLENRYKWAAKISGAIIGLLMAATLSNLGVIPTESPVYDQVWGVVVPLAIPMLLFQCDLKQIWKEWTFTGYLPYQFCRNCLRSGIRIFSFVQSYPSSKPYRWNDGWKLYWWRSELCRCFIRF